MKKRAFFITLALMLILGLSNVYAYDSFRESQQQKKPDMKSEMKQKTKPELLPTKLKGKIKAIKKVKKECRVLFTSKEKGYEEVVLIVTDDTIIVREKDCSKLSCKDLKVGMKIEACFGPMMTKSIPPQSPARKIVVKEDCKCD